MTHSILVVDDSPDNRELYAEYFEYLGFTVEQAADGEEAVAMVERSKPDVVIMDVTLPLLDGWQATRRIKADPRTNKVAVIVLTGHVAAECIEESWAAGADDVCLKPCRPDELHDAVRRLLFPRAPFTGGSHVPSMLGRRKPAARLDLHVHIDILAPSSSRTVPPQGNGS